jgi:hypothetical protein
MPAYVVFASVGFTTVTRRNRVATKAQEQAAANGFTPSTRVPNLPAGTVSFNDSTTVEGTTYPSVSICYEHTDQELVAQAEHVIQAEIAAQGVVTGWYGTWTDFSA